MVKEFAVVGGDLRTIKLAKILAKFIITLYNT